MSTTKYLDVQRTLENLEGELHPENVEAIQRFIDHQAAEGIGESQQTRQIYSLKTAVKKFTPEDFRLKGASEEELKGMLAEMNRSDYADSTKIKFKGALKKFYKVENGGHEHPDKVEFFSANRKKQTPVTRDDLFTEDELRELFKSFNNTRDRAFTKALYESAARPGELLECSISDFTSDGKGDFLFLQGLKGTPDRTNQLVRAGRTLREWLAAHPLGGEPGNIEDPSQPMWVKSEQQKCRTCGDIPHNHNDENCSYEPDLGDEMNYDAYRRRFKDACDRAGIPSSKQRPYNLRHTRLTEVAKFMGYEQLNKFAGWVPGSDRAKVYVHLNSDDVNQAIRDQYGLDTEQDEDQSQECPFCGAENQSRHSECRNCARPLKLQSETSKEEKQQVLEQLTELQEEGVLEKLEELKS